MSFVFHVGPFYHVKASLHKLVVERAKYNRD